MSAEDLAGKAMLALNGGDPREARDLLNQAMEAAGQPRADLMHAMSVVLLQLGEPEKAIPLLDQAVELGWKQGAPPEFLLQVYLALAAANEDTDRPSAALESFEQALEADPTNPKVRLGRANLLLAMGRTDEGVAALEEYIQDGRDDEQFLEGAQALVAAIHRFNSDERYGARDLLVAHRESYCEFFDETVEKMAPEGWVAECARMMMQDGERVHVIAEGARPYAAVRVDLVNFETGQAGQIGDQPMVVALSGVEALARAVVLFEAGEGPFDLRVSSQCPWDQMPVQVLMESGDAEALVDPVMEDWYRGGFEGRFGTQEGGRLHYISDPQPCRDGRGVRYDIDMGRASMLALEDLMARITDLHARHPVAQVIFGRGHLREG